MKTMIRPSFRAFFKVRPDRALPVGDGFFIALESAGGGALAAPAHLPQEPADMVGMVPDAEGIFDHLGHTLGRPKFGGKAVCPRTGFECKLEVFKILPGQPRRASGLRSLLEGSLAALLPSLLPTACRLAGDAAPARHLGRSQSLVKQTGGLEASALQFVEVTFQAFRKSHIF